MSHFSNPTHLFNRADDQPAAGTTTHASSLTNQQTGVSWTDIQNPSQHVMETIAKRYNLHELHVAQCFQRGHIAQVSQEHSYIYLTINFPVYVGTDDRILSTQLNVFLGKDYLITVHDSANTLLRHYFEFYKQQPIENATSAKILYHILEEHLADSASLLQNVFEQLDAIESAVFDDKLSDAYVIGKLRQKIIGLRRTLTNQHEVLDDLRSVIGDYAEGHLQHHYKNNVNVSRRLWEATDEAKEVIEIYQDVDFTSSTAKTNKILAVLTLLFTLTIPATVIGTFYGMNILLPGGIEAGSWTFFGQFTMLKLITAISAIAAIGMYIYFRRKRWF